MTTVLLWLAYATLLALVDEWLARRSVRAAQVRRVRARLQALQTSTPPYKNHVQLESGSMVTMWSHLPLQVGDIVAANADGTVGPLHSPQTQHALGVVVWSRT